MFDTLSTGSTATAPRAAQPAPPSPGGPEIAPTLPRQAKTVRDTGLEPRFVTDLVLKAIQASGKAPLTLLAGKLRLSISVLREVLNPLIAEQQVEVAWCGESDIDMQYRDRPARRRRRAGTLPLCRPGAGHARFLPRRGRTPGPAPCPGRPRDAGPAGRGAGR